MSPPRMTRFADNMSCQLYQEDQPIRRSAQAMSVININTKVPGVSHKKNYSEISDTAETLLNQRILGHNK